jgi:hypothetical protein
MDKKKIFVTKEGMSELKRELEELKNTKRPEELLLTAAKNNKLSSRPLEE